MVNKQVKNRVFAMRFLCFLYCINLLLLIVVDCDYLMVFTCTSAECIVFIAIPQRDEVEVKGSLSVPGGICKPMVQCCDHSTLCRGDAGDDARCGLDARLNAVFDVESYVGHGLLSFYLEVW